MTSPITGSKLERLFACPASAVLPQAKTSGEYAQRGQAAHTYLQRVREVGRELALSEMSIDSEEHYEFCSAIDLDRIPKNASSEVAFAYDVATGEARVLEGVEGRAYGAMGPFEIPMRLDLVAVSEDSVYVGDFKTGHSAITPAKKNAQLLMGALAACKAYGKTSAEVELLRIKENGSIWRDRAELDLFDLEVFAGRLRQLHSKVQALRHDVNTGKPAVDVAEGPHCKYCPAQDRCPAKTAMVAAMLDGSVGTEIEASWAGSLTPSAAGDAYRKWQTMRQLTKRAGDILHAYAATHPIPLGDKRWFGTHEKRSNEKLDGEVVHAELLRLHGREVADAAVKRTATKDALTATCRTVAKDAGLKIKDVVGDALKAIRKAGGSKRSKKTTVGEFEEKD